MLNWARSFNGEKSLGEPFKRVESVGRGGGRGSRERRGGEGRVRTLKEGEQGRLFGRR